MSKILGISAYYHDSAAALVIDGEIIAAAQEERFTRKKQDHRFPSNASAYCLKEAKLSAKDLDYVVFYDRPLLKFERLLETYLRFAPKGISSFLQAMPIWIKNKLWIPQTIQKELGYDGEVLFCDHHESHAASAFFPSPYEEAGILTLDGVGEWTTTSISKGSKNNIDFLSEIKFPHSLGLLYSAFTYYTGFKVNSGEYKLMGLAPYGEAKYVKSIKDHIVDIKDDGSFRLNMDYFNYCVGFKMTNSKFDKLFGGPARKAESKLTQREMDLAKSIQVVTEEIMLKLARTTKKMTDTENLCLAGGVALNCVGNGKIINEKIFKNVWIQPASGDAGGALGAALAIHYHFEKNARTLLAKNEDNKKNTRDFQKGSYLGPAFTNEEIHSFLDKNKLPSTHHESEDELCEKVADLLGKEKVVGWFHGRMEFGPRALGARSILGDARSQSMQKNLNVAIKFRESFRPFAPSVAADRAHEYFQFPEGQESPYMLVTTPVREDIRIPMTEEQKKLFGIDKLNIPRSTLPAITHIDYSARLQTVNKIDNPRYYKLLDKFHQKTNFAIFVNTSFNVRGEPIVCTPEDAYKCFMRTNMDYLVLENFILDKKSQPTFNETINWKEEFALD
ncbi:MAG: carbamoyltransferase [Oligoflexia bacterium]|nr:carbamoyltransferase [Oligoflexia bacterium]